MCTALDVRTVVVSLFAATSLQAGIIYLSHDIVTARAHVCLTGPDIICNEWHSSYSGPLEPFNISINEKITRVVDGMVVTDGSITNFCAFDGTNATTSVFAMGGGQGTSCAMDAAIEIHRIFDVAGSDIIVNHSYDDYSSRGEMGIQFYDLTTRELVCDFSSVGKGFDHGGLYNFGLQDRHSYSLTAFTSVWTPGGGDPQNRLTMLFSNAEFLPARVSEAGTLPLVLLSMVPAVMIWGAAGRIRPKERG